MKGGVEIELPAGFRFHPTDEELVTHYLCRKCAGQSIFVPIIAEIDIYKFDAWQLPSMAVYGEKEWYFFTPRDRKYPNGSRPNRAAGMGYWKATGADKPVGKPKAMGIKKSLVFYTGKAPTGIKTNWIMHEYRLANVDRSIGKKNNLRLDDWVLCRIYNKKGSVEKATIKVEEQEPKDTIYVQNGMVSQAMPQKESRPLQMMNDVLHFDTSESVLSAEFSSDKEVQSAPKLNELDQILDYQMNYIDGFQGNPFVSQVQQFNHDRFFPLEDMFM